ncbi:hypothetical protein [Thermus tengchongensis]|uniref:Stage II sporulation protein M n=1 Tax=Thermus tengchongensis TaxID=1214928 RepID=A0A4Y9EW89_9DEIN|nr:hypothetical protein [Thermus tengchongensis]TFU15579.1 hypothetical protein E0489_09260 [Thermus tengchongensis]TFU26048.1 hypothetical protein E0687_07590 [Thermus tengchongensis]
MRLLAFLLVLFPWAMASSSVELARQAAEVWLAGKLSPRLEEVLRASPEEAPRLLERYALFPPPPKGLSLNLDSPRVEGNRVLFPAAVGEQVGEVVVVLEGREVKRVYFRPEGLALPGYLLNPASGWGFLLLSLFFGFLLLQPSPFRAWLLEAFSLLRAYRGLYLFTNLLLYGLFALGAFLAYGMPEMARALQALFGGALEAIGLEEAVGKGILVLAGVIFQWNFTQGLFLTGLLPALFFGVPALLLNALRYFVFGFALSPALLGQAFLAHLPTLLLELQAYILVTFGGLVLLAKTAGGEGYRKGLRGLLLAFYLGALFLLLAAWYEAWEVSFLL